MKKLFVILFVCFAAAAFLVSACSHSQKMYGEEELVEETESRPDWIDEPPKCDEEKCYGVGLSEYMELRKMALESAENNARVRLAKGVAAKVNSVFRETINRERFSHVENLGWLYEHLVEVSTEMAFTGGTVKDHYLARYKRHEGNIINYYWRGAVLLSVDKSDLQSIRSQLFREADRELRKRNVEGAHKLVEEFKKRQQDSDLL